MPSETELVRLDASRIERAGEIAGRAFFDDPLARHFLPDDEQRRELLQAHFIPLIRYGVLFGEVFTTAETPHAVAVWLPPDQDQMTPEKIEQAGLDRVHELVGPEAWHRFETVENYVETFHPAEAPEPHWYLLLLGVDNPFQGKGLGSALLQRVHERADKQGQPSWTWTTSEPNVPFYTRNGYRVLTDEVEPTSNVRIWTLRRDPQSE
jgi:GNAT superfamily N-acetyltransferase